MGHPLPRRCLPSIALVLCLAIAAPAPCWAGFIPPGGSGPSSPADPASLAALQASLESQLISSRLSDLGVTPQEAAARLASLTPAERERVAAGLASLQAGGEVQVFVSFEGVVSAPLLLGLLALWLLVLAFSSSRGGG